MLDGQATHHPPRDDHRRGEGAGTRGKNHGCSAAWLGAGRGAQGPRGQNVNMGSQWGVHNVGLQAPWQRRPLWAEWPGMAGPEGQGDTWGDNREDEFSGPPWGRWRDEAEGPLWGQWTKRRQEGPVGGSWAGNRPTIAENWGSKEGVPEGTAGSGLRPGGLGSQGRTAEQPQDEGAGQGSSNPPGGEKPSERVDANGKPASAYIRPSSSNPPTTTKLLGLANLIPLTVKERVWRKEFIHIFSLLEVRQAGIDLTVQDKKDEEKRAPQIPRVERTIENWLKAFRTLACVFIEKFPNSAAALWLYEQKIHEAQQQYQGEAWVQYDEGFREKMQVWPVMEWDCQDMEGFTRHMVAAREGVGYKETTFKSFRGERQGRQPMEGPQRGESAGV